MTHSAWSAEEKRILIFNQVNTIPSGHHGYLQFLDQRLHLRNGLGQTDAITQQYQRTLCLIQQFYCLQDILILALVGGLGLCKMP